MLDSYINELYEYFQLNSRTCFISENNYLTLEDWEITNKFTNKFRGHICLNIDHNSTFENTHISESDKEVLDKLIERFDNNDYFPAGCINVNDNGISL